MVNTDNKKWKCSLIVKIIINLMKIKKIQEYYSERSWLFWYTLLLKTVR